jgi:hypothetical protein
MRRCCLPLAIVACVSCSSSPETTADARSAAPAQAAAPAPPAVRVANRPPTPKDVIDAAIASASVPLTVSPTCSNVGTEPTDTTIGRYLAGFLAELGSPDKKNWIETRIEPGKSRDGEPVWISTLTLRHQNGNDRWGWGVRFHVRSSDGLVLADSFTCTGAG